MFNLVVWCGKLYESKADEALDDGWVIQEDNGYNGSVECLNTHVCTLCR